MWKRQVIWSIPGELINPELTDMTDLLASDFSYESSTFAAFRQMSTLSQHRAIHSTERPYICEICQKTFNRVSTLISHRKTHTGLKPHRCYLCSKAFHQKGNRWKCMKMSVYLFNISNFNKSHFSALGDKVTDAQYVDF